ncbi:probable tRNA (guanine(26)-N(2))-dimethyltransferase [Contarinia nasturtii]|uniref:probable tRNA (guanine(26)-N(2))-dimethyltransferase n=1 Tax=Contarinia nasturtii TaxID=265458 RepID=UPI0012D39A83|nr:probable tRNA (guanine(26)-N(2))-dimethyltransferase [Contarinia nasturtii]
MNMEIQTNENLIKKMEQAVTVEICEGSAKIISENRVFYNPVQQFNRDLSLSVLSTFWKICQNESEQRKSGKKVAGNDFSDGLRVLEALSATGLRSIRYAKEVPGIKEIIANDLSSAAVKSIKENIKLNNVEHLVTASEANATTLMYNSVDAKSRFDAIDLDPYGNPTMFLDGAVQSISEGGILLITATDMAILAGNNAESCYAKYGSVPLKTKACHEQALRILLRCIESHATRYGRYIKPLLSISADFYIRVFVRVFTSPLECKKSSSKQSMFYECTGCSTHTFQPLGILKPNGTEKNPNQFKYALPVVPSVKENCEQCKSRYHMGGPIWTAPIHDQAFVDMLYNLIQTEPYKNLETNQRIYGMLSVIREELLDVPLYYTLEHVCCVLKLQCIPIVKLRSALLHAGYKVSFSHANKTSIKTNAPSNVLWDILRNWAKLNPVNAKHLEKNPIVKAMFSKEPENTYNLNDIHPEANPSSRAKALSRFPANPMPNWGPGTRSTLMIGDEKLPKKIQNQNKNKQKRQNAETTGESQSKQAKTI